jgi:hypothetical protein
MIVVTSRFTGSYMGHGSRDVGISYKLSKLINSGAYFVAHHVYNVCFLWLLALNTFRSSYAWFCHTFLTSECPTSDTSLTADGPFQRDISVVDEELSDISVDSDTTSNGCYSSANSTSTDTCDNSISDSTHVKALKILPCFQNAHTDCKCMQRYIKNY